MWDSVLLFSRVSCCKKLLDVTLVFVKVWNITTGIHYFCIWAWNTKTEMTKLCIFFGHGWRRQENYWICPPRFQHIPHIGLNAETQSMEKSNCNTAPTKTTYISLWIDMDSFLYTFTYTKIEKIIYCPKSWYYTNLSKVTAVLLPCGSHCLLGAIWLIT